VARFRSLSALETKFFDVFVKHYRGLHAASAAGRPELLWFFRQNTEKI
jgi:hypothetical protein